MAGLTIRQIGFPTHRLAWKLFLNAVKSQLAGAIGKNEAVVPCKGLKFRVPDTFQLGAICAFSDYGASSVFNKLRVFNTRNIPTPPASTVSLVF